MTNPSKEHTQFAVENWLHRSPLTPVNEQARERAVATITTAITDHAHDGR